MNRKIRKALSGISDNVHLFSTGGRASPPYIVYGIDGEKKLTADNRTTARADSGYIDLFTADEDEPLIKKLTEALDEAEIAYNLNAVQIEEKTGLMHYEWRWESGED